MKVYISCDERWPDYSLYGHSLFDEGAIEVPEALWNKYILISNQYKDLQKELNKYWRQNENNSM